MPTCSPLPRRTTLLLGSTQIDGPKARKSREKLHFLSLKTLHFFKICSPLSPRPDPSKMEKKALLLSPLLPHVQLSLVDRIPYPLYPPTLNFYPIRRCHMSPIGPILELKLTHSAPDMWHTVSHSKCGKCPALRSLPRKTCKFQLSRNSTKFDVVARFRKTIPMVKSVSSSEI